MKLQEGFIELTKYEGKRAGTTTTIVNERVYRNELKLVAKKAAERKIYRNPFEGWLPTDELNEKIKNEEVQTPESIVAEAVSDAAKDKIKTEDEKVKEKIEADTGNNFETISAIQPYFKLKAYAKSELGLEFDNHIKKKDLLEMIKGKVNE